MKQESGQDNVQDIFQRYEMLSAIAPYSYVVVGDGEIFKYEYSAYRISLYKKFACT